MKQEIKNKLLERIKIALECLDAINIALRDNNHREAGRQDEQLRSTLAEMQTIIKGLK